MINIQTYAYQLYQIQELSRYFKSNDIWEWIENYDAHIENTIKCGGTNIPTLMEYILTVVNDEDRVYCDFDEFTKTVYQNRKYMESLLADNKEMMALYNIDVAQYITANKFDISKHAYELYKQQWLKDYVTSQTIEKTIAEYNAFVADCAIRAADDIKTKYGFNDVDDIQPAVAPTFEEYIEEYGYTDMLPYKEYKDFLRDEYTDKDYVDTLFNGSPILIELYDRDIAARNKDIKE